MDYEWLNTQFSLHPEKSKSGLALALGLSPPAISKILKGSRQIKAQEYMVMREYFDMPMDSYSAAKIKKRPSVPDADKKIDIPKSYAQHSVNENKYLQAFDVIDNKMQPSLCAGEQVIVNLKLNDPREPGIYLLSDGYTYMVRKCSPASRANPERIRISANDKSFKSQVLFANEFEVIGRVISKISTKSTKRA